MSIHKDIYNDLETRKMTHRLGYLGVVLGVSCALLAIFCSDSSAAKAIVAVIWGIGPPCWFFYEYHFIFRAGKGNAAAIDEFKHSQDLAAKIWAGFAAVILLLFQINVGS